MPYVDEEQTIKTKVIGVASKVNDGDDIGSRQVLLKAIKDDPNIVSIIYLRKREVWVSLIDGNEYYLGDIRSKYEELIMKNVTQIDSWELTGGWDLPEKTILIAGQPTAKTGHLKTKIGMNLHIKLL